MDAADRIPGATADGFDDAVAAAGLTVLRRALVEGVPVTRDVFVREACVHLDASPKDAMRMVDDVAQRLGVSSLS